MLEKLIIKYKKKYAIINDALHLSENYAPNNYFNVIIKWKETALYLETLGTILANIAIKLKGIETTKSSVSQFG